MESRRLLISTISVDICVLGGEQDVMSVQKLLKQKDTAGIQAQPRLGVSFEWQYETVP